MDPILHQTTMEFHISLKPDSVSVYTTSFTWPVSFLGGRIETENYYVKRLKWLWLKNSWSNKAGGAVPMEKYHHTSALWNQDTAALAHFKGALQSFGA